MEMDLTLEASSSEAILTLTDRKTDYIFLKALPHGRKTKPIARAVNSRLALLSGVASFSQSLRTMAQSLVLLGVSSEV